MSRTACICCKISLPKRNGMSTSTMATVISAAEPSVQRNKKLPHDLIGGPGPNRNVGPKSPGRGTRPPWSVSTWRFAKSSEQHDTLQPVSTNASGACEVRKQACEQAVSSWSERATTEQATMYARFGSVHSLCQWPALPQLRHSVLRFNS